MKFQVLMSTMNKDKKDIPDLIKESGLKSDVLIINQCGRTGKYKMKVDGNSIHIFEENEKGLSKSRNEAMKHNSSDICLIADDDMKYESDLNETILDSFEKYPNYDLIAFYVERSSNFNEKKIGKCHEVNKLQSLGLISVQIAFRKDRIKKRGILFDERFGAGSDKYICGEENIFLMDNLRSGNKILYVPKKIATTVDTESSWFHGYNKLYFISKGAVFQRLFPHLGLWMIYAFAFLKRNEYIQDEKFVNAIRYMKQGRNKIQKEKLSDFN